MIRVIAGLGFLLFSVGASQAGGNCTVMGIRLKEDVTVTGYMYVKSGKNCGIQARNSRGGTAGIEVTRRPVHGRVQSKGLGIVYTARAGFTGADSFSYVRHSRDHRNGSPIRFPVNVEVTVTP